MASEIIPARVTLVPSDFLPLDASPQAHADYCARRARECTWHARVARRYGFPSEKWLRAARLFRYARIAWRERQAGVL